MFRMLKLKPPHGWNVVGWELVIVVVGVLLALLAQQWVSERDDRAKMKQSLDSIRSEIGNHYAWSVEWRVVEPCMLAQIDSLQDRVMKSGDRLDPAPVYTETNGHYVLRMPSKEYVNSAWQAAQADGVSADFDPAFRFELSSHYEQARLLAEHGERNGIDYRRLLVLSRPIPLDPSVRYSILQTLAELRGRVEFIDILSGQIIDHVQRLRMVPPEAFAQHEVERYGTYQFCKTRNLPLRSFKDAMQAVPN
jgi:hypothetical protein